MSADTGRNTVATKMGDYGQGAPPLARQGRRRRARSTFAFRESDRASADATLGHDRERRNLSREFAIQQRLTLRSTPAVLARPHRLIVRTLE